MYSDENLILQLAGLVPAPVAEQGTGGEHTHSTWGLKGDWPLASVYAPLQEWRDAYDEEQALSRGTLFRELDKPFLGREVTR